MDVLQFRQSSRTRHATACWMDGLIYEHSDTHALPRSKRTWMIDTGRVAVGHVSSSFRIDRVVYARMHVGKHVVVGHRVCDSHDERRELEAERLGVVISIRSEPTVHRTRWVLAYRARGERNVVTRFAPAL